MANICLSYNLCSKVVARNVDPNSIAIASVMTANPKCVLVDDPAIDALTTMIENHFRKYV